MDSRNFTGRFWFALASCQSLLLASIVLADPPSPQEHVPQPTNTQTTTPSESADDARSSPATPIQFVLRVSENVFKPFAETTIDQSSQVDKDVLGTRVRGLSRTHGDISVSIVDDLRCGAFQLTFTGQNNARTRGQNGGISIAHRSHTDFVSTIRVTFDPERGFQTEPAKLTQANTRLQIEDIQSSTGGLRGRIMRRIAWRRAQQSHGAASAVASRDTNQDVLDSFNRSVATQIENLNRDLRLPELLAEWAGGSREYQIRSTRNYLEICFGGRNVDTSIDPLPHKSVARRDVEIWVHGSVVSERLAAILKTYDGMVSALKPVVTPLGGAALREIQHEATADLGPLDWQTVDGWMVFGTSRDELATAVTLATQIQQPLRTIPTAAVMGDGSRATK